MPDAALLQSTYFLDAGHPSVAAFAMEAAHGATDERDRAVRLFYAVRDRIRYDPYSMDLLPETFRASTTLERGIGFCVTKAILLAAAWRAAGIPSRLGFADVTNHLASRRLVEVMGTNVFAYHGFALAFLDGRWVKATPAFNASLCAKFGVAPLEWDGTQDAVLQPFNQAGAPFMTYLVDRGTFDDFSLDDMVRVWRVAYPQFFEAGAAAPAAPAGNLEDEVAAERRAAKA